MTDVNGGNEFLNRMLFILLASNAITTESDRIQNSHK